MIALLIAGAIGIAVALLSTPFFISWTRRHNIGQQIRADGPHGHHTKAGTPTMGGLCIIGAALLGYAAAHARPGAVYTRTGLLVIGLIGMFTLIGFIDDWVKVRNGRSLGLTTLQKFGTQIVAAVVFAVLAINWAGVSTKLAWTRSDSIGWDLGPIWWSVLAVIVIVGSANAVNLTDGLDGLAAGTSSFAFSTFIVIGFWQLRHFDIYKVPHSLDLALIATAMTGACLGFLWWNAAPAKIFMGDTGSLSIGAGVAALALVMNLTLLLPVIGGIFVIETLSVIMQVVSFRFFGRRRIFRMAPIHHHFELLGWPETHVIVRFWILAGLFTALGLGLFYADFLTLNRID